MQMTWSIFWSDMAVFAHMYRPRAASCSIAAIWNRATSLYPHNNRGRKEEREKTSRPGEQIAL